MGPSREGVESVGFECVGHSNAESLSSAWLTLVVLVLCIAPSSTYLILSVPYPFSNCVYQSLCYPTLPLSVSSYSFFCMQLDSTQYIHHDSSRSYVDSSPDIHCINRFSVFSIQHPPHCPSSASCYIHSIDPARTAASSPSPHRRETFRATSVTASELGRHSLGSVLSVILAARLRPPELALLFNSLLFPF
jgi:hypothetical protein